MKPLPFATQTGVQSSLPWSAQRLVNWHAIPGTGQEKSNIALFEAPGLLLWITVGTGPIRGLRKMGSLLYVVSGSEVYTVAQDGTATLLGSGVHGGDPVIMDDNGTQMLIVTAGWAWMATATTLSKVSDPDFLGASSVSILDTYAIFTRPNSGEWFISALGDADDIDALDFASAERRPDNLVRGIVSGAELVLFGEHTTEFWQNTGASPFPFERVQTAVGDTMGAGCAAPLSVVPLDNSLWWLADDKTIRKLQGYGSVIVSSDAINQEIATFGDVSGAQAFGYSWKGRQFYCITFPQADRTFQIDVATGLPHERRTGNQEYGRWRGNCFENVFSRHLIGDVRSGKVYQLDTDTHTDGDDTMVCEGVSPHFHGMRERVSLHQAEAEFEAGIGLNSGQGSDPQAMLSISKDGGKTFGNEKWRSIGLIGRFLNRVRWFGLGSMYQGCIKIRVSDPVRRNLIGFWGEWS